MIGLLAAAAPTGRLPVGLAILCREGSMLVVAFNTRRLLAYPD